jgi:sulfur-oxidizing protein SoxY
MIRQFFALAFAAGLSLQLGQPARAADAEDVWPSLATDVFKGRPLVDGVGIVGIEMPARAEDAAIVPVTMRVTLPKGDARQLKALTLIIDENPAPVAATFKIGERSGISTISTRVRVNAYTNVHAVAELSDGQLYMVKTYVKASGGCAAPAAKNADEAAASVGQMKFRQFGKPAEASAPREAQVMIRHPNNSGLQRDQVTLLYIPPFFVSDLNVWEGDKLLFTMEGGISISEDPNFRFDFRPNGADTFRVEAKDTDGKTYSHTWPASTTM